MFKNIDLLCLVYKKNYFLSLHSPIFHLKIHKRIETFFERGGNSCKMSRDEQGRIGRGGGGSKIGNFKQTYFLNATKVELNPVDIDRNANHLI